MDKQPTVHIKTQISVEAGNQDMNVILVNNDLFTIEMFDTCDDESVTMSFTRAQFQDLINQMYHITY